MNLPDAPVAREGFFGTHFFTVRNQEKSKDFYVRILGGKVIKPENPCYIKLANSWVILNSGGGRPRTPSESQQSEQLPSIYVSRTFEPVTKNGVTKARSFLLSLSITMAGNGVATCKIQTAT